MWQYFKNYKFQTYHNAEILEFENIVCEMAAILSRPQCVKLTTKPRMTGLYMGNPPVTDGFPS